jgi:hypothetical protein
MKTATVIGLLFAACPALLAQMVPTKPAISSASGQFAILDRRGGPPPALPGVSAARGYFDLEPPLLAVSCERIKEALNQELAAPGRWSGRILVTISPAQNSSEDYAIAVDRFRNGWNYHVNLPQRVERRMFVRTLVNALLLELANRQAHERSAEIPFWLIEGLTQKLLASREAEMILAPPVLAIGGVNINPTMIERRENDALETARRVLRDRPPLTLEELSWPRAEDLTGTAGEVFQCSAQLLVAELLRLKDGRQSLRDTVIGLGSCYNWQTAFLKAFKPQFANQLAFEKWWALQAVYFTGRNPLQLWTSEESWRKLDEALLTPVAIRQNSLQMPARAEVPLQAIIREWDTLRQLTTFRGKRRELELVRVRVAPEFMALTDEYLRVVKEYVRQRERTSAIYANLNAMSSGQRKIALETIRELDELDANRASLRPKPEGTWSAVPPPSRGIAR